ncbi:MAG: alcohol dehydrogenase [Limisphaerales bacterium]|nr:MAG: alcohol dehydrogenase [Limisphaerales bacterium]KAG0509708.1 MAG: alcohol dehydrogenase [Limisphaerales bacterium]TXT51173.1 MAG: alcohol dehydrogenase [Limisphaerales bacterium]
MSSPVATFSFPTQTLFGPGTLNELPARMARLGMKRPLVVTDAGLLNTDAFSSLSRALGEENRNRRWFLYSGVHPNPIESDVREAAALFQEKHCDGVIAIGGGSALDAGKATRLLAKRPGFDFAKFYDEPDWSGLAPFIAIPTTAGTGSEVGRSSVITLDATKRKAVLFHPELLAKLVILDPELTVGLPPKLTAATGADALTHCIESFTCPAFHPMCDGIALEGIQLIVDALPRAVRDGKNLDARGKMLVAAAMGAIAFQKDLGVVHSLAHPLSTICGMHHGLANALCLVASMKFCAARKPGLYRRIGIACGLDVLKCGDAEADRLTIAFIGEFLTGIGLYTKLRDHGVKPEHLDALVAQAWDDPCHKTNAVPVTVADLRTLYEAAM